MKKSILMLLVLFTFNAISAQETSKNLLGKWKLETVSVSGETHPALDVFGTSEVYQIYKAKNIFNSFMGDQSRNGKWKLSKDEKTIFITGEGEKATFVIISMDKNKMTLELDEEGELLQLNYRKNKTISK